MSYVIRKCAPRVIRGRVPYKHPIRNSTDTRKNGTKINYTIRLQQRTLFLAYIQKTSPINISFDFKYTFFLPFFVCLYLRPVSSYLVQRFRFHFNGPELLHRRYQFLLKRCCIGIFMSHYLYPDHISR